MIYFITALYNEAKPLLEQWSFKRDKSLPYRLYYNDRMYLLVTQIGMENATEAVQSMIRHIPPKEYDILINVGLCAAPEIHPLGSALYVHSIYYKDKTIKLPGKYNATLPSVSLRTVDLPVSIPQDYAVDMEAYAIYKVAHPFFHTGNIIFFKIVSDHFKPELVDKKRAIDLIRQNMPKLELIMTALQEEKHE